MFLLFYRFILVIVLLWFHIDRLSSKLKYLNCGFHILSYSHNHDVPSEALNILHLLSLLTLLISSSVQFLGLCEECLKPAPRPPHHLFPICSWKCPCWLFVAVACEICIKAEQLETKLAHFKWWSFLFSPCKSSRDRDRAIGGVIGWQLHSAYSCDLFLWAVPKAWCWVICKWMYCVMFNYLVLWNDELLRLTVQNKILETTETWPFMQNIV